MSSNGSLLRDGQIYLTEAGAETEVMYKWGFELPHFAMFTLLDDREAVPVLKGMFRRYMAVAAQYGTGMLLGGLDYRASGDWGTLLGYSPDGLVEMQTRCIAFLREIRDEYRDSVPDTLVSAILGPRGDAYNLNRTITAGEAEAYHAAQLEVAKAAGADHRLRRNVQQRARSRRRSTSGAGPPSCPSRVYLTLDSSSRLRSGPSLREAVEAIEAQTDWRRRVLRSQLLPSRRVRSQPSSPASWTDRLRSVRPNASAMEKIALCKLGHLEDGDPVELGQQVGDLARRLPALDIVGGCCGTDERHLTAIARNVLQTRRAA